MKTMLKLLVMCLCFLKKSEASIVSLEAYPQEIKVNLTESASLICKVVNNNVQSRASSSATDVRHISSIFVSRGDGDDVASVTAFDPPTALADLDNLQVKGSVSALSGEGSLELTWRDATKMPMGDYVCTVDTIDNKGHAVVLTSHIIMTSVEPSIMDMILDLKSKISKTDEQHQQDITKLHHDVTQLQQENTKLQQDNTHLQQDITQLQVKVNDCNPKVAFQARLFGTATHVVSGQTVVYETTMLNDGNGYNNSTGTFTCSIPGTYWFNVHAESDDVSSGSIGLYLKLNSDTMSSLWAGRDDKYESASMSAVLRLNTGDVVKVVSMYSSPSDSSLYNALSMINVFNGHIIHAAGCKP